MARKVKVGDIIKTSCGTLGQLTELSDHCATIARTNGKVLSISRWRLDSGLISGDLIVDYELMNAKLVDEFLKSE